MHEIASQTLIATPAQALPRSAFPLRQWLRWLALLIAIIFIADGAASWLVQRQHVRVRLNARLQAAFGRPVDVDRYSFSLWGGPTLEAEGVRVGEDPRFGKEYFLYADAIDLKLRWLSLLRGRFELQRLALTGATLNVVTDTTGNWNLAEWLGHPPASLVKNVGPSRSAAFVPRFREIKLDDGRVNFKRGDEKLPFAFVNVSGTISTSGDERWNLDVEASPWRAAEMFQQAGTIHLAGNVGGTSSALRPAAMEISWSDAAVSDFLRLVGGNDPGVRGGMAMAFNARTSGEKWAIEGHANFGQLHRWDLTQREDDPSLSLDAKIGLDLQNSTIQIVDAVIEGPHSNLRGSGSIVWGGLSAKQSVSPVALSVRSANIDFNDLLAWLRAFRTNVPPTLATVGIAQAHGSLSGWPIRMDSFSFATSGVALSGGGLPQPVHLGELQLRYDQDALEILPATITFAGGPESGGSFRVEMAARAKGGIPTGLHVSGAAANTGAIIAAASALGWNVSRGWQLTGPFHCDLRWPGLAWPWKAQPLGAMSIGGPGDEEALLHAPFLNLPVTGVQARVDWKPEGPHVTLQSADAFGANWSGTLDRDPAVPGWQFSLSADRLDAADLDRWLNPRWRESFLDRMLPFLNTQLPVAVPETLRATGHISVGQLSAVPFNFRDLEGALTLSGRHLALDNATATLAGGAVTGSFETQLASTPEYAARARFSGLSIGAFSGSADAASSPVSGAASGTVQLAMRGSSRSDLAQSLDCKGSLNIRNATWRGVAWVDSLRAAKNVPGSSAFGDIASEFACTGAALSLKDIVFSSGRTEINGSGSVDFARSLALDLHVANASSTDPGGEALAPSATVHVSGTLAAPTFGRAAEGRRAR